MATLQKPPGKVSQSAEWDAFFSKIAQILNVIANPTVYTVATLPAPGKPGRMIYVLDDVGGPTMAYSDGNNWKRTSDGAVGS